MKRKATQRMAEKTQEKVEARELNREKKQRRPFKRLHKKN